MDTKRTDASSPTRSMPRQLTGEEQAQWLAAIEQSRIGQSEMLARRGGELFTPSYVLINEARDQRTADLEERHVLSIDNLFHQE